MRISSKSKNFTLKELIYLFLESVHNQNTARIYAKNLNEFYIWNKDKEVDKIQQQDIDKFINKLEDRGFKHSTINGYLFTLKSFFEFCSKYVILESFHYPIDKFKKSLPNPNFISKSDYDHMLNEISKHFMSTDNWGIGRLTFRNLLIIQLLIEAGLTVSELCHMKIKDIDLLNKRINIVESGRPTRILYLSQGTVTLLKQFIENVNIERYLFYRQDRGSHVTDQSITPRSIQRVIRSYSHGKFSPRDFRWTFILLNLLKDKGIYEVSDMVGGLSDDTKTFFRLEIQKHDKTLKVTENDYNAYEYLRHKHGKKKLLDKILSGELSTKFSKELAEKYKI